jgi:hypothetical protein
MRKLHPTEYDFFPKTWLLPVKNIILIVIINVLLVPTRGTTLVPFIKQGN